MTPTILTEVPWQVAMPGGPQQFFIILNTVILALALFFVFVEVRRRKDWVPVYLVLGAGLAIFYEPLGDMLVSALYPVNGQIAWIETFGRKIPLFIGILYFWYMSVPVLVFMKALENGVSRGKIWLMYIATIVFAIAYEILGVNMGAWLYYGEHAFMFMGVPLWAPFTYGGFCFALCAGCYTFVRVFPSQYHGLLIIIVPMLLAASHCALALPAATAMFSDMAMPLRYIAASISIGLSIVLVWGVSLVFGQEKPRENLAMA